MEIIWLIWFFLTCFFVLLELTNPGFFLFLGTGIGASISMVFAYSGYSLTIQLLSFLVTSIIAIAGLMSIIRNQKKNIKTNTELLLGKKAVVTKTITLYKPGQVDLDGEIWMAKSNNEQSIEPGTKVTISKILGAHVLVEKNLQKENHG